MAEIKRIYEAHELIVSFEILKWVHSSCNYIDVKRCIDKHQETSTQHIVSIHNYLHEKRAHISNVDATERLLLRLTQMDTFMILAVTM